MNVLPQYCKYRAHLEGKDYVIVLVSVVLLCALRLGLPKLFKETDERVLNAASWVITTLFMLALMFMT